MPVSMYEMISESLRGLSIVAMVSTSFFTYVMIVIGHGHAPFIRLHTSRLTIFSLDRDANIRLSTSHTIIAVFSSIT
jgi:hypothetical protein